jgi:hypothetical protein
VLYDFTAGPTGAYPSSGVALDPAGRIYGTTLWADSLSRAGADVRGRVPIESPPRFANRQRACAHSTGASRWGPRRFNNLASLPRLRWQKCPIEKAPRQAGRLRHAYCTATVTAWLTAVPTVTTTGMLPAGVLSGSVRLIWKMPETKVGAGPE